MPDSTPYSKFTQPRTALAAILIAGFVLRVSGITWGVPLQPFAGWYHPDEKFVFFAALWNPTVIRDVESLFYPTFFQHLLVLISLPLRMILDADSERFRVAVVVAGRFCSVLAGTGAVYLTFRLARRLSTTGGALLAAAFLAVSLYHAQNSAFGTTDVLTSFFLVLFLFFLQQGFGQPERVAPFVYAGGALGLLAGSKYTGVIALAALPVLVAHQLVSGWRIRETGSAAARMLTRLGLCGVVSVAVFGLTTPGAFFDLPGFLDVLRTMAAQTGWSGADRLSAETWTGIYRKVTVAVGWPLTWLAIVGLVVPLKRTAFEWSLLVLLAAFFLYFSSTMYERYVVTVSPVIAILAAHAATAAHAVARRHRGGLVSGLAVALVLVYSAGYSIAGAHSRRMDTRATAARYLRETFAPGTRLGLGYTSIDRALEEYPRWMNQGADFSLEFAEPRTIDDGGWTLWNFPRIDFTYFEYMDFLDYPEVIVLSSDSFRQIEHALKSDHLLKDYVWDQNHKADWFRLLPPSPRVFAFYDRLFNSARSPYTLVRTFRAASAAPIEFESPEIRVYVASAALARHTQDRAALSLANVHYNPPLSEQQTVYPGNPRGYFDRADSRQATWQSQVLPGNTATVRFPASKPDLIEVGIQAVDPSQLWNVQVSRSGIPVRRRGNILSFKAKAAGPRTIAVGASRTDPPQDGVGLYQTVDLDTEWRSFRLEFQATSDEDNGRIHFDLAASNVDIEIDQVRFEIVGDDGHPVAVPEKAAGTVRYRFNGLGCRGEDYPVPPAPGTSRALLLGNSWALGVGLHEADSLSTSLQRLLNRGERRQTVVINCGVNDHTEREARLFYEITASHYDPALVLLLMAPPREEIAVDVTRRYRPILTSHLNAEQLRSLDAAPARGAARPLDAHASVRDIAELLRATHAAGSRLAVVIARDGQDTVWSRFAGDVDATLRRAGVPALMLTSLFPDGSNRHALVVYPGVDGRPNELAIGPAAAEVFRFLEEKRLLP